ncbi:MAG TPA: hypothetical protein VHD33_01940 [Legionellaceae bacterium]|nr:hypothetical protein [Legionellaceae bacterium]
MPRYIVKLADDIFVEWSTVSDCYVTPAMNKEELREYCKESRPDQDPDHVVNRVIARGHSAMWMYENMTPEDAVSGNRCGPNETQATLEEIIADVVARRDENAQKAKTT